MLDEFCVQRVDTEVCQAVNEEHACVLAFR